MRQARPVAQIPRLCGTHSVPTSLTFWGLDMPNVKLMSIVNISGVISFALKELNLAEETDICSYIAVVESSTGCWNGTEEAATNGGAGWMVGKGCWEKWELGINNEMELVN